jgi:hypothetical protein
MLTQGQKANPRNGGSRTKFFWLDIERAREPLSPHAGSEKVCALACLLMHICAALQPSAHEDFCPAPLARTLCRESGDSLLAQPSLSCQTVIMRGAVLIFMALSLWAWAGEKSALLRPTVYGGEGDASGAVAVTSNLFLVADDEDNSLRLYRNDMGGPPIKEFDCNAFLELSGKSMEADLEAGARIGNRAYWIGSHGRNKNGKERPNRCRLFATDLNVAGDEVKVTPVGKPYKGLLNDLIRDPRFEHFHFAAAARLMPKKAGAFNIEGLSAMPKGHLLIGFRNPIPQGKALLIPLLNPNEVIEGNSARFGSAIQLDLGGLGIRDIAFYEGIYIISAGPYHGGGPFRFYRWSGPGTETERIEVEDLKDYHPEAVIIYPDRGLREIQVLSDDGKREVDDVSNRDVLMRQRTFRSFWIAPGGSH